jgi:hypothetical protein
MEACERDAKQRRCGYRAAELAQKRALDDFSEALDKLRATRPRTFAGLVAKAKAYRAIEPDGDPEDAYCSNEDIVALAGKA